MSLRDTIKRFFIIVTVVLCVGLAVLFGAIQAGWF